MMLWCIISMAFFRRMSAWDVVSRMNIMLPGHRPLVAPSAVVQACQRLGSGAVLQVFNLMQKSWHESAGHPSWAGLRLLGDDGVVWRTPDTPGNRARSDSASDQHGDTGFPFVQLIVVTTFGLDDFASVRIFIDLKRNSISHPRLTRSDRVTTCEQILTQITVTAAFNINTTIKPTTATMD